MMFKNLTIVNRKDESITGTILWFARNEIKHSYDVIFYIYGTEKEQLGYSSFDTFNRDWKIISQVI